MGIETILIQACCIYYFYHIS